MDAKVKEIISRRIALKDKIAQIKSEYDERIDALKDGVETCDAWLLKRAEEAGVDQFACQGVGTAYKSVNMKVSCGDWPALHAWVLKTKNIGALEQRVSKTFIKEFKEEHEDELPPGVKIFEEVSMNVRRSPQPKGDAE